MDTLIGAVIGIVATLLATWFATRMDKSTSAKTQLLLKIDDWVNDVVKVIGKMYWKGRTTHNIPDKLLEDCARLQSNEYVGVSKALKNKCLVNSLDSFRSNIDTLMAYFESSATETNLIDMTKQIKVSAEEVHKVIAQELIRIL